VLHLKVEVDGTMHAFIRTPKRYPKPARSETIFDFHARWLLHPKTNMTLLCRYEKEMNKLFHWQPWGPVLFIHYIQNQTHYWCKTPEERVAFRGLGAVCVKKVIAALRMPIKAIVLEASGDIDPSPDQLFSRLSKRQLIQAIHRYSILAYPDFKEISRCNQFECLTLNRDIYSVSINSLRFIFVPLLERVYQNAELSFWYERHFGFGVLSACLTHNFMGKVL